MKRVASATQTRFSEFLRCIVQESGLLKTTGEWADLLFCHKRTLQTWLDGTAFPRPEYLGLLYGTLMLSDRREWAKEKFGQIIDLPLSEITTEKALPLGKRHVSFPCRTLRNYLLKWEIDALVRGLFASVPPDEQEAVMEEFRQVLAKRRRKATAR